MSSMIQYVETCGERRWDDENGYNGFLFRV
jgi:hypothetical protein